MNLTRLIEKSKIVIISPFLIAIPSLYIAFNQPSRIKIYEEAPTFKTSMQEAIYNLEKKAPPQYKKSIKEFARQGGSIKPGRISEYRHESREIVISPLVTRYPNNPEFKDSQVLHELHHFTEASEGRSYNECEADDIQEEYLKEVGGWDNVMEKILQRHRARFNCD